MIRDIGLGFSTFFNAIKFIGRHKLNYFYIFPLVLSTLIYWLFSKLKTFLDSWILELINHFFDIDMNDTMGGWLERIIYWSLTVSIFFLWLKINRYIVLILLSPMLSILSEKTETKLTGKTYPFSIGQLITDIWRGSIIALKNICIELSLMIIAWVIVFFFPPSSIITAPLMMFTAWYYMGFSFLDYNYERRQLSIWEGSNEVWNRKGIALVHGGIFLFLSYIPVIGVVFGSVWCTIASTLAVNAEEMKNNL